MTQATALEIIERRAARAGLAREICIHRFCGAGITQYLRKCAFRSKTDADSGTKWTVIPVADRLLWGCSPERFEGLTPGIERRGTTGRRWDLSGVRGGATVANRRLSMHKVREVLRRYCAGDSAFAQANDQAGRADASRRTAPRTPSPARASRRRSRATPASAPGASPPSPGPRCLPPDEARARR